VCSSDLIEGNERLHPTQSISIVNKEASAPASKPGAIAQQGN